MFTKVIYLTASLMLLFSCEQKRERAEAKLPYNFFEPDYIVELEAKLNEISSIEYVDSNTLMGICDEAGVIYFIHATSGVILDQYIFDSIGDYEGLAINDSLLYAMQSNGDIYVLSGFTGDSIDRVQRIVTGLDEDCEGFCYNPKTKRFYIAAKGNSKIADKMIYSIDGALKGEARDQFPLFFDDIKDKLLDNAFDKFALKLRKLFSGKDEAGLLGPSGLAIHPITGNYFLLSGTSSLLIELNTEGKVLNVFLLPKSILKQPEGLCFDPEGNLFISSEKANNRFATVVKYTYND